ncbi:MAG: cytochrome c biogenesis protein CcdA, partial [Blastocatellia bacterium]
FISASAVRPGDKFKIAVQLDVAPGYHINAHVPSLDYLVATNVTLQPPSGIKIDQPVYPAPELKSFTFAPDTKLAVHEGRVIVTSDAVADASLKPGETVISAKVEVQSCNDSQCLAPATLDVQIPIKVLAAGAPVTPANSDIFAKAAAQPTGAPLSSQGQSGTVNVAGDVSSGGNQVSNWIGKYGLGVTLFLVFLSGLALNTTPCVYPIIPITIGFFANQSKEGQTPRMGRLFAMSAFYVLGIGVTYSVLGVIASLTHGLFGSALRNPFVLIGLAVVMVVLALSMFGVYEFRLPEFLNRFATSSTQSTSGMLGALVMGLTMGIVAAPCIGPFVVALLVHVGAKGSPSYGFLLFFVLSLGLGAPYLVLGTFSGAISKLPRSGMWMVTVRKVFGLVLIGMAIYFLMPLLAKYSTPVLVVFFAAAAIYLILWESGKAKPKQFGWVLRIIGLAAAALAIFFVLPQKTEAEIEWQPYSEQALQTARTSGKPVIIDVYADWCIPCKELDKRTFTDAAVKKEADKFVMLKLNLTTKTPGSEIARAVDTYHIPGVPTVVFIDSSGQVANGLTLQEFEKPDEFIGRMKKLASTGGGSSVVPKGAEANVNADQSKPLPGANPTL